MSQLFTKYHQLALLFYSIIRPNSTYSSRMHTLLFSCNAFLRCCSPHYLYTHYNINDVVLHILIRGYFLYCEMKQLFEGVGNTFHFEMIGHFDLLILECMFPIIICKSLNFLIHRDTVIYYSWIYVRIIGSCLLMMGSQAVHANHKYCSSLLFPWIGDFTSSKYIATQLNHVRS